VEAEAAVAVGAPITHVPDDTVIRDWVESLSDVEVLKYTVTICDVLTGLLLLMAVLSASTPLLAVVAASADALLRVAGPLLEAVDAEQRKDFEH